MDVVSISDTIQTQPNQNVYRTAADRSGSPEKNPAQPAVEMIRRLSPSSADDILDFISSQAKKISGLITAHTHSEPYPSYQSPAALPVPAFGEGAGADFSYPAPRGEIPMKGSQPAETASSVFVLV